MQEVKVDSFSHNRNQSKIAKEEAELAALLKEHLGEEAEDAEQEESSGDVTEEPSSASESSPEQEEEPQAEAQEDDAGLSAEEANFKKRYGDLRRHQQAKEAEYKQRLEQLELQLKEGSAPGASPEQIQAWAKQNPQAEQVIRALADEQAQAKMKEVESRLAFVEEQERAAKRSKAEAKLMALHPDFEDIRKDDAFHAWAKDQPQVMQDALYNDPDDVKGVSRVLDLYKADKGITTKKQPVANKDAAKSVKSRSAPQPQADDSNNVLSESKVAKMSTKEFEKRQEEIQDAMRSGKFIYDLSGR